METGYRLLPLLLTSYTTSVPALAPMSLYCLTCLPNHPAMSLPMSVATSSSIPAMRQSLRHDDVSIKSAKRSKKPKFVEKSSKLWFFVYFHWFGCGNFACDLQRLNHHSSNPPPKGVQTTSLTSSVPLATTFCAKLSGNRYLSVGHPQTLFFPV